jgi:tetratricopeptide (TPR) repeat protein
MAIYQKILDKNPADGQILQIAGNLSVVLNRFEEAVHYYQQLLEVDPGNEDATQCLEKIQRHLDKKQQDGNPDELYQQARQLADQGQVNEAIGKLEQVITLDADCAQAYNDLGVLYHQSGDGDRALENYKRATALDPVNKTFQKNLADFYYVIMGRVADALGIYLDMLKSDPEDIEVLTAAGHICCDLGKPEDAEVFFSRVLEIEPWNAQAGEYLHKLTEDRQENNVAGMST